MSLPRWALGPEIGEPTNPALGLRGVRLGLAQPRLLETQIAAILRAAMHGPVRILLPMVATVSEVRRVRAMAEQVAKRLKRRGLAIGDTLPPIGVMIEVPAAALTVATLARGLDFVSIGTNDLTQYAMAADRVNSALAPLQDATAPGVVALIAAIVAGAAEAGVEVGVCGELAGSAAGATLLTDLGIRELSMDPAVIDEVREALIGA